MLRLLCGGVWRRDELDARDAVSEGEVPSVGVVAVAEESADSGVWLRGSRGDAAGDGDDEEDDGEDEDEEEEEDDDDPALTESRNEQLLWLGQPSGVAGCGCGCSCGCLGSPLLIGGRGRGLCAGRTGKKTGCQTLLFGDRGKGGRNADKKAHRRLYGVLQRCTKTPPVTSASAHTPHTRTPHAGTAATFNPFVCTHEEKDNEGGHQKGETRERERGRERERERKKRHITRRGQARRRGAWRRGRRSGWRGCASGRRTGRCTPAAGRRWGARSPRPSPRRAC